jgi:tetratricopeptide (TPR) repeat protein
MTTRQEFLIASNDSESLEGHCDVTIRTFKSITRFYALFHIAFLFLFLVEISCFFLFFSFVAKSFFLAISIAVIFFTGFAYFVLLLYFQAKKPEQMFQLKQTFIEGCQKIASSETDAHLFLAQCAYRLVSLLHSQEYTYYPLPIYFQIFSPIMEKLSVWTYWQEALKMKEMFLFIAIEEHLKRVKLYPTKPQTHAALAQSYLLLSKLYADPRNDPSWQEGQWVSAKYFSHEMRQKYKAAAQKAIEEFKILLHFSPREPWVYAELATLYHSLELHDEERKTYEALLQLTPDHNEVLLRLGILYFNQGLCAQGLTIYEKLKSTHDPNADTLISHYDASLISLD